MSQNMLIKVTDIGEILLANDTTVYRLDMFSLVAAKFPGSFALFSTLFAIEFFLMNQPMVLQSCFAVKLPHTEVAREGIDRVLGPLLVTPLVALDVLDFPAAKSAHAQIALMDPFQVDDQVEFLSVRATAVVAAVARLCLAV